MSFKDYIAHAWNTIDNLVNKNTKEMWTMGPASFGPSGKRQSTSVSSSALSRVVYNRIATDCAMVALNHVKMDSDGMITEVVNSKLQNALTVEANLDQSAYQFLHDMYYSMCDEQAIAVVPTETTLELNSSGTFDIEKMRVGRILQWYPNYVEVELYDERDGRFRNVKVLKQSVAILENPFSDILSSNNASLTRLKRKMSLLDSRDEEISSGTFNMVVKLPYAIKGKTKTNQAEERRKELEQQLKDNAYGIAYTGHDEEIVQLNRPIANDLADQVKYLQTQFYNQLGLTENIFNGTASEAEMNNYFSRSLEPCLTTVVQEFRRKFLTKTARSQGHSIEYLKNPFTLVPLSQVATIVETLTRNAVATPNEMRKALGFKKALDPNADVLGNRNISEENGGFAASGTLGPEGGVPGSEMTDPETDSQNGSSLMQHYFN